MSGQKLMMASVSHLGAPELDLEWFLHVGSPKPEFDECFNFLCAVAQKPTQNQLFSPHSRFSMFAQTMSLPPKTNFDNYFLLPGWVIARVVDFGGFSTTVQVWIFANVSGDLTKNGGVFSEKRGAGQK